MIAEGEVYSGPRFSPDTTVLLTAECWLSAHNRWPGPTARGRPRLLHDAWLEDDFREPSFLRLISNAVHWTGLVHGG